MKPTNRHKFLHSKVPATRWMLWWVWMSDGAGLARTRWTRGHFSRFRCRENSRYALFCDTKQNINSYCFLFDEKETNPFSALFHFLPIIFPANTKWHFITLCLYVSFRLKKCLIVLFLFARWEKEVLAKYNILHPSFYFKYAKCF